MKSAEGLYASISPGPRHSCLEALSDIAGRSHQHARAVSLGKMGARKISKQDPAPEPGGTGPLLDPAISPGQELFEPPSLQPAVSLTAVERLDQERESLAGALWLWLRREFVPPALSRQ